MPRCTCHLTHPSRCLSCQLDAPYASITEAMRAGPPIAAYRIGCHWFHEVQFPPTISYEKCVHHKGTTTSSRPCHNSTHPPCTKCGKKDGQLAHHPERIQEWVCNACSTVDEDGNGEVFYYTPCIKHNYLESPAELLYCCVYCKHSLTRAEAVLTLPSPPTHRNHSGSKIIKLWKSQDGRQTPICEMTDGHLGNTLSYLIKRAANAVGKDKWNAWRAQLAMNNQPTAILNTVTGEVLDPIEFVYRMYPIAIDLASELEFRVHSRNALTTPKPVIP